VPWNLSFLGAAGTVTGSKFLMQSGQDRLLVDAGLYQGEREWRRRNWDPFPVDPAGIAAVVITHAHLDHCGYLPVLVREGFAGPVVCSAGTARLMGVVLRDAAHLQEEEARWSRESGLSRHQDPRPLFDSGDVERTLALLSPTPLYDERPLVGDASVSLHRAGHILGSRFAVVTLGDARVVFSGDLGRPDHPLLLPPDPPGDANHFVLESTYGERLHEEHPADDLRAALVRTLGRGGTALLPAFAVDRTPLLLREISQLIHAGRVPDVPVYVDSPMALAALDIYRDALASAVGEHDFRPELLSGWDPFNPGRLRLAANRFESEKLNDPRQPCIVISASGMATGGRVLHHLEHQLPRSRNCVILTGYQVAGTRGRALADGATSIKIHGRYVQVRAEIASVRGYSAHADAEQMLSWLQDSREPQTAFIVHGEPASSQALSRTLHARLGWNAVVPRFQERVSLGRS
jgi:metallo-beta-lactamase family protein